MITGRPLEGLHVVDLTRVVSGPFAMLQLADLGARVTKVEPPGGDLTRWVGPRVGDVSAYFYALNRGKRSIVLDLRVPSAQEVLAELVETADVVAENFRPGVADRLGLSDEAIRRVNPRAVVVHITGFGRSGPYAAGRVYDKVVQGVAGLTSIQHGPDHPELLETPIADKVAAMAATQAVLAALFRRERTGVGDRVDIDLLGPLLAFAWPDRMMERTFLDVETADAGPAAPYALLRCRDGWVAVTAVSESEWAGLADVLDEPGWVDDHPTPDDRATHWPEVLARARQVAAGRDRAGLLRALGDAGVPAGPVNTFDEVPDDPQVVANGAVVEAIQPGVGRVRVAAPMTAMPEAGWTALAAPRLGEQTEEVLRDLGHDASSIGRLRAEGAVA